MSLQEVGGFRRTLGESVELFPEFARNQRVPPAASIHTIVDLCVERRESPRALEERAGGRPLFLRTQVEATTATERAIAVQAGRIRHPHFYPCGDAPGQIP